MAARTTRRRNYRTPTTIGGRRMIPLAPSTRAFLEAHPGATGGATGRVLGGSHGAMPAIPAASGGFRPAGGTPAAPGTAGAGGGPGSPGFIPDSEYLAAVARLGFQRDTGIKDIQQQHTYDATDLAEAIRRTQEQRPKDEQQLKESMNAKGLYYSGQYGKAKDELAQSFIRQQADVQQAYDRREAARQAAQAALEQGYSLDEATERAAAAGRQIQSDQEAAKAGALAPNPNAAQKPAGGAGGSGGATPGSSAPKPPTGGTRPQGHTLGGVQNSAMAPSTRAFFNAHPGAWGVRSAAGGTTLGSSFSPTVRRRLRRPANPGGFTV